MVGTIIYQLTQNLSPEEIEKAGFQDYFVDHTTGIYPSSASGVPYNAFSMQSKGDPITDLHENLAAEQKARTTYDNILRFCDDPDVIEPIKFLRAREVVHYQRFGDLRAREVVHYQRFGEPKQTNYNFHCISILSENTKILLISNSTTLLLSSKERSFHFVITSLKTL